MSMYIIRLALRRSACSDVRHSAVVRCMRVSASIGAGIRMKVSSREGYKTNTVKDVL